MRYEARRRAVRSRPPACVHADLRGSLTGVAPKGERRQSLSKSRDRGGRGSAGGGAAFRPCCDCQNLMPWTGACQIDPLQQSSSRIVLTPGTGAQRNPALFRLSIELAVAKVRCSVQTASGRGILERGIAFDSGSRRAGRPRPYRRRRGGVSPPFSRRLPESKAIPPREPAELRRLG
jgi:hypothetical protein